MNTYRVISVDKSTGIEKIMAENLRSKQAAELARINRSSVIRYADSGALIAKKHRIEIDGTVESNAEANKLAESWDEIRKAAQLIKDGGKIKTVWKNGRVCRYVEAKT